MNELHKSEKERPGTVIMEQQGISHYQAQEEKNMKKTIITAFSVFTIMLLSPANNGMAADSTCPEHDAACKEFAMLAEKNQFERIIEQVDAAKVYSSAARGYIGQAYLMLAGNERNTQEQEEQFCRKALEYGSTSAYMGLYFIYSGQNTEAALGYLKQYVATKPGDPVPYVLLGESELEKKNYQAANTYLREAKRIARGHSAHLDWMLFRVNYILGDFAYAGAVLDGAMADGQYVKEFKTLASDPLFEGMVKRPEFRKYEIMVKETTALAKS